MLAFAKYDEIPTVATTPKRIMQTIVTANFVPMLFIYMTIPFDFSYGQNILEVVR